MPKQRPLSTAKRVFVIRDDKTGLYSTGGYVPNFVALEKAKTWPSAGAVSNHLKLYERGFDLRRPTTVPKSWEVLELEVTYTQKWSNDALGFLRARKSA